MKCSLNFEGQIQKISQPIMNLLSDRVGVLELQREGSAYENCIGPLYHPLFDFCAFMQVI
jgi:hypothetical protein